MTNNILRSKGFTLVEILIAVFIISLLAGVISVSIKKVRIKSDNIARLQQMEEYQNAVFFMVRDNGGPAGLASWDDVWCIGVYTSGKCSFFNVTNWGNTDNSPGGLNDHLKVYLPSLPTLKPFKSSAGKTWNGPMYGCGNYDGTTWVSAPSNTVPPCTPMLKYALEGDNQECGFPEAVADDAYSGVTYCILPVPYF